MLAQMTASQSSATAGATASIRSHAGQASTLRLGCLAAGKRVDVDGGGK